MGSETKETLERKFIEEGRVTGFVYSTSLRGDLAVTVLSVFMRDRRAFLSFFDMLTSLI